MIAMQNARRNFWNKPATANRPSAAIKNFSRRAVGSEFETRYIGESLWWPISAEELAQTLEGYHGDLDDCLRRMLGGEVLASPLAQFRLVSEHPYGNTQPPRVSAA
jgi:hypothetical protein